MKILRSVTRRGYTVAQAGFFSVTSPNRWFPASKLPDDFPELSARPKAGAAVFASRSISSSQRPSALSASQTSPPQFKLIGAGSQDHRLLRLALIVLAAGALTIVGLWAAGDTPSLINWTR